MAEKLELPSVSDLLVARGVVSREEMERVRAQTVGTLALIDRLVALGIAAEEQVARALADETGCPYVTVALDQVDAALVRRVPADRLGQMRALPLLDEGEEVDVAFADPTDVRAVAALAAALNRPVRAAAATTTTIRAALREVFGSETGSRVAEPVDEASGTLRLYGHLLACVRDGASDLVLAPDRDGGAVRVRRGGRLYEMERLRSPEHAAVVARLRSLIGGRADAPGRRSTTLRSEVAGRSLWLTIDVVPTGAGDAARVHLEPVVLAGAAFPGGLAAEQVERLSGWLATGEGLLVLNDRVPERAAAALDGFLRAGGALADQRVAVGWSPAPALEGAILLDAEAFGDDLGRAVRAALALDPDVLVVRPVPGDPPPREALAGLAAGRRLVVLGAWRDAAAALIGLRAAGLPSGRVETALRWVVTLAPTVDDEAACVDFHPADAAAIARCEDPDALRGFLQSRERSR